MTTPPRIAAYLDQQLKVDQFKDSSNNGLQVANSGRVDRVCCGVDASLDFFREAHRRGAGLLVCHHGLSWGDSLKRLTGLNYRLVSFLLRHDLALYAAHLPLDAHPTLGNNVCLARALGLRQLRPFGRYHEQVIGIRGALPSPLSLTQLAGRLKRITRQEVTVFDFGRPKVRTVAMVVGSGSVGVEEAAQLGVDVYLSGEPSLAAYNTIRDLGMNALFGGHYATESLGVQAVGKLLTRRFGVPAEFIDLAVPF
jgi:dinuclear metal center YbgI/SA1388 family protein